MFHGSVRLIHRVTVIAPGAILPNINGPHTYTSPPANASGVRIVNSATPIPTSGVPWSIRALAAPGKVSTVRRLPASIEMKGVVCTTIIKKSAVRENEVTLTSEAGRFWNIVAPQQTQLAREPSGIGSASCSVSQK